MRARRHAAAAESPDGCLTRAARRCRARLAEPSRGLPSRGLAEQDQPATARATQAVAMLPVAGLREAHEASAATRLCCLVARVSRVAALGCSRAARASAATHPRASCAAWLIRGDSDSLLGYCAAGRLGYPGSSARRSARVSVSCLSRQPSAPTSTRPPISMLRAAALDPASPHYNL